MRREPARRFMVAKKNGAATCISSHLTPSLQLPTKKKKSNFPVVSSCKQKTSKHPLSRSKKNSHKYVLNVSEKEGEKMKEVKKKEATFKRAENSEKRFAATLKRSPVKSGARNRWRELQQLRTSPRRTARSSDISFGGYWPEPRGRGGAAAGGWGWAWAGCPQYGAPAPSGGSGRPDTHLEWWTLVSSRHEFSLPAEGAG